MLIQFLFTPKFLFLDYGSNSTEIGVLHDLFRCDSLTLLKVSLNQTWLAAYYKVILCLGSTSNRPNSKSLAYSLTWVQCSLYMSNYPLTVLRRVFYALGAAKGRRPLRLGNKYLTENKEWLRLKIHRIGQKLPLRATVMELCN